MCNLCSTKIKSGGALTGHPILMYFQLPHFNVWPMSSISNATCSPCKIKVESEVLVHDLLDVCNVPIR